MTNNRDLIEDYTKQIRNELLKTNTEVFNEEERLNNLAVFTAVFEEHDADKDNFLNEQEFINLKNMEKQNNLEKNPKHIEEVDDYRELYQLLNTMTEGTDGISLADYEKIIILRASCLKDLNNDFEASQ